MDSSMPFLRNQPRKLLATLMMWCLVVGMMHVAASVHAEGANTVINTMRLERTEDGLHLSAQIKFDLPTIVEDALIKGIPMFFVAEAEVSKDRWYWYDKKVAIATRQMRLSFQPLTRRWRLNVTNGVIGNTGLGVSLPQYFDSLPDALAKIQRITNWKIAELTEVESDASHTVDLRFKLDVSQLPRPFQIGLIGNGDWAIYAIKSMRLASEGGR
ncbi:MAG: DUF4390 domain-containing protein [Burkholderiaceae bacterium]